jgi:hypothetical protein
MTTPLLKYSPESVVLNVSNLLMVDGGNENGYRRQCGIPAALVGNKSGKAQRGAGKAPRSMIDAR